MVAEAEVMHQQPAPVLEAQYRPCVSKGVGMSAVAVPEVEVAVELPRMVSSAAKTPAFLCSYANPETVTSPRDLGILSTDQL